MMIEDEICMEDKKKRRITKKIYRSDNISIIYQHSHTTRVEKKAKTMAYKDMRLYHLGEKKFHFVLCQ